MKRLVLVALLVGGVLWPAAANAAVPCRNKIYNDWYADGKIATTYPIACYRDAIKHAGADATIYSSLIDDIKAAERGALERKRGRHVASQIGKGPTAIGKSAAKGKTAKISSSTRTTPAQPANQISTISSAPTASTGGGSGVPVPIIVLGALALLLVAIGAVGAGVRHRRSR